MRAKNAKDWKYAWMLLPCNTSTKHLLTMLRRSIHSLSKYFITVILNLRIYKHWLMHGQTKYTAKIASIQKIILHKNTGLQNMDLKLNLYKRFLLSFLCSTDFGFICMIIYWIVKIDLDHSEGWWCLWLLPHQEVWFVLRKKYLSDIHAFWGP